MKHFLTDEQKEKFGETVLQNDIVDETIGYGAELYHDGYTTGLITGIIGCVAAGIAGFYIYSIHLREKKSKKKERADFDVNSEEES